jgi:hypothetical protein
MFAGKVAQKAQEAWNGIKATMKQDPVQTLHSINKGLNDGSIKNGLIKSVVHNVVKVATGTNSDRIDVAATATVGGAELNGQTAIANSGAGKAPEVVAPQLEEAAQSLGGMGAKNQAGVVGSCCEVHAANELLLKNPGAAVREHVYRRRTIRVRYRLVFYQ